MMTQYSGTSGSDRQMPFTWQNFQILFPWGILLASEIIQEGNSTGDDDGVRLHFRAVFQSDQPISDTSHASTEP